MSTILTTILSLSVSGSILALILFAGKPLLKNRLSKTFSYYIWLLVLLRLVLPVAAPVNIIGSLLGIGQPGMNSTAAAQTGIAAENGTVQDHEQIPIASNTQAVSPRTQARNASGAQWLQIWSFIKNNLLWIWMAGSVVSLGWFITAYAFYSHRIWHSCVEPHGSDLAVFEQMHGNNRVHMACSSYVATPMFLCVLGPIIVLPQLAYVQNGRRKELENILRHELTHYRRKDILYKWLVVVVTSIHWFNPLMLLIRKEISQICELSCDEAVISPMSAEEKQCYGNTLLSLSANRKLPTGILATTLCEDREKLKERLISIMNYKKKSAWTVALTLVLALLLVGCAATLGVPKSSSAVTPQAGEAVSGTGIAQDNPAKNAYLENISGVLKTLDKLENENPGETWKTYFENCYSGALEDLDNDGQNELLMAYMVRDDSSSIDTYYYKIYTFESGNSVLLGDGTLFVDAGGPQGGIKLVKYNGEQYICVWNDNSEAGERTKILYSCNRYTLEDSKLSLKHTINFTYFLDNSEPVSEDAALSIDGKAISFEEFQQVKNNLDNPVKELCAVGNGKTNYTLRQLYKDLQS